MATTYPTYSDVVTYAGQIGIDVPSQVHTENIIDDIINQLEDGVGFVFEADSTDQNYDFYLQNTNYLLIPPFVSITSISANSNVLDSNSYTIMDREIYFDYYINGKITITGKRGYTNIPSKVWRGIIDMVIYRILVDNPAKTYSKLKQLDVEITLNQYRDVPTQFEDLCYTLRY